MTVSRLPVLGLALASLALTATACADVGSSDRPGAGPSLSQDKIICNSIRTTMQKDKAAADAATAAGDKAEAARKMEAVRAGAEGASTVKDCDTSDIIAPSTAASTPATPPASTPPSP
ncbi:MAG: hypothetical protein LC789_13615 [Actinobacteria bacterium]|nr:hypothetical protein [Actinomycetota bacterium]MCA1719908.1 hypothetical protein [Actinomycetota bacterium]